MSYIYKISDDIHGDRSYFKDEYDEWISKSLSSKFHEGYYESRLERAKMEFLEQQEQEEDIV